MSSLAVAILAGGKSTRMGEEKATLTVAGKSMLQHVVDAALGTGLPVLIVGKEQSMPVSDPSIRICADDTPGAGPLGGIATALRFSGGDVLALGCDMPMLRPDAIRWLADMALASDSASALVAYNGDFPEPLFSVYSQACLPHMQQMLERKEYALWRLIEQMDVARIAIPEDLKPQLRNVNTKEELQEVRKALHQAYAHGKGL